jgi:MFS family permease
MSLIKSNPFRAFKNRNYSLFFTGQSLSQIGTWMQRTAVNWVVLTLTHSAFMLGLAIFCQQFPSFLLSLPGGVVADRYSRRKILLVTQAASMIQAVLLAALILSNHYVVWEILSLGALLGIINAFDTPARQPMVHDMVEDKSDIPNAVAMNSVMVNIARIIGPALSGFVLQLFGAGICFSINALSFIAVIGSLLLMKFPRFTPPAVKKKVTADLAEGFVYLKQTPRIGLVIVVLAVLSLLVFPYDTMVPVFAKTIFKGNATTYGMISSVMGGGAILGSFFLASVKKGADLRKIMLSCVVVLGLGLITFSFIGNFYLSMPFAVIIGFGSLTPMATCITIVQVEAAPNMRGRGMSYVAMAFFGMLPLGSLLVGFVSQKIGVSLTMLCQGVIALVVTAMFWNPVVKSKNPEQAADYITGVAAG